MLDVVLGIREIVVIKIKFCLGELFLVGGDR